MGKAGKLLLFAVLLALLPAAGLYAQTDTVSARLPIPQWEFSFMDAEEMHHFYDFDSAIECYEEALSLCKDSLKRKEIEYRISLSANGRNMTSFCTRVKVVARKNFALKDFFLYYPLQDKAWHPAPNRLDSLGGPFSPAVYVPSGAQELYWSARDSSGVRNIMRKSAGDSVAVKAPFSSPSDDILPLVCGDRLYFSSKGLYGVGGYDLYECRRLEDGSWSRPENMGFPYSSPEDDFLFMDTPDGRYSIFASNRDCDKDSVSVYVLEYELTPVRVAITDMEELRSLSRLDPPEDMKKVDNKSISSRAAPDASTRLYMEKVSRVRAVKDSLDSGNRELLALRASLLTVAADGKDAVQEKIYAKESEVRQIQLRFDAANKDLQKTEMDFLMNGVLIDRSRAEEEADKEVVGADRAYTFTRKSIGAKEF